MTKKVKYALVVGAYFALVPLSLHCHKKEVNANFEVLENDDLAFASFSGGKIYIGNEDFLNNINYSDNDILVVDERDTLKNMKILSSYKINDQNTQDEVLYAIKEYENQNPSEWNRSIATMRTEWQVHNMLYNINYKTWRTQDVDFENNEEYLYDVINKVFHK